MYLDDVLDLSLIERFLRKLVGQTCSVCRR